MIFDLHVLICKSFFVLKMGYGYGIWLRIENNILKSLAKHQPHITVMCNMTKENATILFH
jgi:hypothetical protein